MRPGQLALAREAGLAGGCIRISAKYKGLLKDQPIAVSGYEVTLRDWYKHAVRHEIVKLEGWPEPGMVYYVDPSLAMYGWSPRIWTSRRWSPAEIGTDSRGGPAAS